MKTTNKKQQIEKSLTEFIKLNCKENIVYDAEFFKYEIDDYIYTFEIPSQFGKSSYEDNVASSILNKYMIKGRVSELGNPEGKNYNGNKRVFELKKTNK